ncbi:MAG: prefoldin subunit beta [Methanomassiliicoccales archaeon]|nr:MAG: prefoldin subunit beta [Methanomassiliicoccales archaeon]
MEKEMSAQLQNKIAQFQHIQQQIQVLSSQKFQLEAQLRETERALSELDKISEDTPVYKSVGSLLVKAEDKEGVEKELNEKKETIDIRIKALDRQEKHLVEKYQALQQELSAALTANKQAQDGS